MCPIWLLSFGVTHFGNGGIGWNDLERFGVEPLAEREKAAYRKSMEDGGVPMKENDGDEVGVSDRRDLILERLQERGISIE